MIKTLLLSAAVSNFSNVQIVKVYDGDTFTVQIPRIPDIFGKKLSIRIRGIDAPEIKASRACEKRDALLAKEKLQTLLQPGIRVNLSMCIRDKYFRAICDVTASGDDATAFMLASGLSEPYTGQTKIPWICRKPSGE